MPDHSREPVLPTPLVVMPRERLGRARLGAPPAPPTRLLGRDAELARVVELLTLPEVRLVTLTGPGGVGKTRLAISAHEAALAAFGEDGIFVPLAAVDDPSLLAPTILQALGGRDVGNPSAIELLISQLEERELLLTLDNLEQLGDGVEILAPVLAACPGLTMLATSRTRLALQGEVVVSVPPLALPGEETVRGRGGKDERNALPLTVSPSLPLEESPAVRLFVERAAAVDDRFGLTEANEEAVAALCRRVDGLPLAIELVAAQVGILTPAGILEWIDRRLPLPVAAPRDAPVRQRSLEAVVAWSYEMLSAGEQRVFRRLAVFSGSFDLGAANAVARGQESGVGGQGRNDALTPGDDLLPVLAGLVEKSLLVAERGHADVDGGPRFRMLETIRDVALGRLVEAGEEELAREAHAAWFLDLAERRERSETGPRAWDPRDVPNVRAALHRFEAIGDGARLVRMMSSQVGTIIFRVSTLERRDWLERAARLGGDAPTKDRMKVLAALGIVQVETDDLAAAEATTRLAVEIEEASGEPFALALALLLTGAVTLLKGRDPGLAEATFTRGLRLLDGEAESTTIDNLRAFLLANAGVALLQQGRYAEARERHHLALDLRQAHGDRLRIQLSLSDLADVDRDAGEADAALERYRASLTLVDDPENLQVTAVSGALFGVACTLPLGSDAVTAVQLLAAGAVLRERTGIRRLLPNDRAAMTERQARLRQELGDEAFVAAWEMGRRLSLAAAIDLALGRAVVERPADEKQEAEQRGAAPTAAGDIELTRREHEVLRLLVAGRTDREIADALSVSPRTAQGHVGHLLDKLGVQTRTAAVAAAISRGLVVRDTADGR